MGRWMEVSRQRGAPLPDYEPEVLGEGAPHPLLDAAERMSEAVRFRFPMLSRVRLGSGHHKGELQVLNPHEAAFLLEEVQLLRRVCRREAFVPKFDGAVFYGIWRGRCDAEQFEPWLNHIEDLLRLAVREKAWVRMML